MGWGSNYRNSGISHMANYAEALNKFETTKPIRGREVECRPLGHRDRSHFSIAKVDNGDIHCYDYNPSKPTVTFRPNGDVVLTPLWLSTSTCAFIGEVVGLHSRIYDHSVVLYAKGMYRVPKIKDGEEGFVIRRDPSIDNYYRPVNPMPEIVHHINRKQTNIVRSKYVEVRDYISGFAKLRAGEGLEGTEMTEVFGSRTVEHTYGGKTHTYEVLNTPDIQLHEPESVAQMMNWLASEEHYDRYKGALALASKACRWRTELTPMLALLDRCILAHHKTEVFHETRLPLGEVKRDAYGWAFR